MQLQGYKVPAHLHCVNIVDVEAITVCYRMLMNQRPQSILLSPVHSAEHR